MLINLFNPRLYNEWSTPKFWSPCPYIVEQKCDQYKEGRQLNNIMLWLKLSVVTKSRHQSIVFWNDIWYFVIIVPFKVLANQENLLVQHVSNRELSKPRRQRQRERRQTKGLVSEQYLCTCVINLCTFRCRSLQNNNVKWPSFAYCRSSRKRTPSGRDINVRNWSWPPTRMVLVSGH